jgi:hypothetical protein
MSRVTMQEESWIPLNILFASYYQNLRINLMATTRTTLTK